MKYILLKAWACVRCHNPQYSGEFSVFVAEDLVCEKCREEDRLSAIILQLTGTKAHFRKLAGLLYEKGETPLTKLGAQIEDQLEPGADLAEDFISLEDLDLFKQKLDDTDGTAFEEYLTAYFKEKYIGSTDPVTNIWVGAGNDDELIVNVVTTDMTYEWYQQTPFEKNRMVFRDHDGNTVIVEVPLEYRGS